MITSPHTGNHLVMSRTPPNLQYLTIYNPTLHPNYPVPDDDDEDAEEQAHILFYTSKERVVSRDRMLRQVGLAKALVSFSEMFNANDACNSVHSQSRRMVMVSPEPDFWIHACVEVPKVPRAPQGKARGKTKEREKLKTPEIGKKDPSKPTYDYHEGSIHDVALRQDILRGYERFKLVHGSFTSILSTLGKQALELQLDRFFTPWAWSWNLEAGHEFSEHLGTPLHPSFQTLVTILDKFSLRLPNHSSSIIISPPHVVPCNKYSAAKHSPYLPQYLLSLVPRIPETSHDTHSSDHTSDRTVKLKRAPQGDSSNGKDPPQARDASQSMFLGIPSTNGSMDVRKWNWPGYLSFGRGSTKRSTLEESKLTAALPATDNKPDTSQSATTEALDVDKHALEDAISENISLAASNIAKELVVEPLDAAHSSAKSNGVDLSMDLQDEEVKSSPAVGDTQANHLPAEADTVSLASSTTSSEPPPPVFSFTTVYLADPENPLTTQERKIYYTLVGRWMLALVGFDRGTDDSDPGPDIDLHGIAEDAVVLFDDIESALRKEMANSADSLPSATKILQPTDSYIISTFPFTLSSPGFTSNSSHLYNAQELQTNDPEISEVFSRGQNPQHWHIARRGLGMSDDGVVKDGEVYMEVFRKEASLSDVDNVLAGVVRRCGG